MATTRTKFGQPEKEHRLEILSTKDKNPLWSEVIKPWVDREKQMALENSLNEQPGKKARATRATARARWNVLNDLEEELKGMQMRDEALLTRSPSLTSHQAPRTHSAPE